eukprot:CAMPEP_0114227978 /NCGR_PEP_ID=MMETSP0058-20121206/2089_1 /TAXON_ID=36894 /ORGANISM="Pyramimonas parkeae, CCMP726" /LENGTH=199 /DNA_ID=CAMNT_0001338877 /DNA_START=325 /DNA_END=924 /DNA_ORIENTATION=-
MHSWKVAKAAWRRVVEYVRVDLREIILPSPLPDPPGYKPDKIDLPLTWTQRRTVWQGVYRDYIDGWKEQLGMRVASSRDGTNKNDTQPTMAEELAETSKLVYSKGFRPVLQNWYANRATLYRDSVTTFVEAYREGLHDAARLQQSKDDSFDFDAASRPSNEECATAEQEQTLSRSSSNNHNAEGTLKSGSTPSTNFKFP